MLHLKVHHIGYLVKKKAKAKDAFLALGYLVKQDWVRDESRGIDICFLEKDSLLIELVCPFTGDSLVSGLLARMKNSPYHICYVSEHPRQDAAALRDLGYLPITEAQPAPACGMHPVQFFLHPALGMIEVLEHPFSFE
ncbi:MAG: VOC family protein [Eubacteriales bacterium]|nr:VOC family protein [Eubacteriales bacterium]